MMLLALPLDTEYPNSAALQSTIPIKVKVYTTDPNPTTKGGQSIPVSASIGEASSVITVVTINFSAISVRCYAYLVSRVGNIWRTKIAEQIFRNFSYYQEFQVVMIEVQTCFRHIQDRYE